MVGTICRMADPYETPPDVDDAAGPEHSRLVRFLHWLVEPMTPFPIGPVGCFWLLIAFGVLVIFGTLAFIDYVLRGGFR